MGVRTLRPDPEKALWWVVSSIQKHKQQGTPHKEVWGPLTREITAIRESSKDPEEILSSLYDLQHQYTDAARAAAHLHDEWEKSRNSGIEASLDYWRAQEEGPKA